MSQSQNGTFWASTNVSLSLSRARLNLYSFPRESAMSGPKNHCVAITMYADFEQGPNPQQDMSLVDV